MGFNKGTEAVPWGKGNIFNKWCQDNGLVIQERKPENLDQPLLHRIYQTSLET